MEYIKYKIMSDGFTPDDKQIKNKKDLEVCINAYSKIKKLKMKNKGNNEFAEQEHIKLNFFSKIAKFQNPSQAVYIGLSKVIYFLTSNLMITLGIQLYSEAMKGRINNIKLLISFLQLMDIF